MDSNDIRARLEAMADKDFAAFSAKLCDLLARHAGIPADQVYVTFHPMAASRWGWNGGTF
ncbi:MAG: hypothetical protein IKF96_07870 [Eggerthellaceae bacterium]|nr:hypothetical protein [Eggerthellaceae bacterium]